MEHPTSVYTQFHIYIVIYIFQTTFVILFLGISSFFIQFNVLLASLNHSIRDHWFHIGSQVVVLFRQLLRPHAIA